MQVEQLKDACLAAINRGQQFITLVTKSTRLLGRRGPIGELRCENPNGEKIVAFKAQKVLDFIRREESR